MLKVVPVIDILGGIAVHAIRGRRSEYQPLKSALCASADPLIVALAFKALGFSELYIADLEAIMAGCPNFSILKQIADITGLSLMVDAGVADLERAETLLRNHVSKVVIGTETLSRIGFVGEAVRFLGKERVVVSLDLKGEKAVGVFGLGKFSSALGVLREFQEMGVDQVIVLDLDRVGSGEGVNMPLLKEMLKNQGIKVFVGGGVRDINDLRELQNAGVFGVLVATALHSGRISLKELRHNGFL